MKYKKSQMFFKNVDYILDLVYDYGQDFFVELEIMKENDFNQMLNILKERIIKNDRL